VKNKRVLLLLARDLDPAQSYGHAYVVCWFVTALQGARSCRGWGQYYLPVSKGTCLDQRSCWCSGALTYAKIFFETMPTPEVMRLQ